MEIQRALAEERHARELAALVAADTGSRPPGWRLSPRAVVDFIVGLARPIAHPDGELVQVERKFYGDDALVERAVITLTTSRGLMLVGEPGTAKTMLSELLAAAISADSTLAIQGSAGTTEDQVRYGWNYAALLASGPSMSALVPAPLYLAMEQGLLVRFEEITRCAPEVQDVLLSPLSDRLLLIPELAGAERIVQARVGFNVIGTANTRDRGVSDMSAALKRRFNFETVRPIRDLKLEVELVLQNTNRALAEIAVPVRLEEDVARLLVTTFQELREGITREGDRVDCPTTPMSTAEAVAVATSSGCHAHFLGSGQIRPDDLVRYLMGTVLKDDPEDRERLVNYFERIAKRRAKDNPLWKEWSDAKKWL
ncbi:MAG: AAA family ATPase [Bradymonadaceae bacterium]|nr:AAA family ATPase [Lujinxingiaceae bacterium]